MDKERSQELCFDEGVELIRAQFTDLFGQSKAVEMAPGQAAKLLRDGYAVNRFALGGLLQAGGQEAGEPGFLTDPDGGAELYLKADMDTYQILPWDSLQGNVARVICHVCNPDGTVSWMDSRGILKKAMARAEAMGLQVSFDFQCEFYLFHTDEEARATTITHEPAGYYDGGPVDFAESVRRDIFFALREAGIEVESAHHGLTPGQHSFLLPERYGAQAGDFLQTFKSAVKRIAKRNGLHATFMPKPNMSGDGSGLHVGVFIRETDGAMKEETAKQFRAGVLCHLREMLLFTNPLVNSYKRLAAERSSVLQPEFPAASWERGSDKAVRVVKDRQGGCAVQVLFPDPSANPYLALTAILAAGLDGIERGLRAQESAPGPLFPETLGVLIGELDQNHFAKEIFGEKLCRLYREGKREEWERFCAYVTDWEIREYLYRY